MFNKVLVPLDGSDLAEAVLPYVEDIATRYSAEVILLRVVATPQDRWTVTVFQPPLAAPGSAEDVVPVPHPVYREQEMESHHGICADIYQRHYLRIHLFLFRFNVGFQTTAGRRADKRAAPSAARPLPVALL